MALGLGGVALAVTLPTTFTAGAPISASQINANFEALNTGKQENLVGNPVVSSTGAELLRLNEDGGFSVQGTLSGTGSVPVTGEGTRMMWIPSKSAFRVGTLGFGSGTAWDDVNIGASSTAMGFNTTASGLSSTAMGTRTTASGDYSTAMGSHATAGQEGSFVYGDRSTTANVVATNTNQFIVRAVGGVRFYSSRNTNPALGSVAGCFLFDAGTGWSCTSDRNAKTAFQSGDAQGVLEKVARLPLHTWQMKGQSARVRHLGATAQDFRAAFGLGENETSINSVDADGVALAAIQGLNAKVDAKQKTIDAQQRINDAQTITIRQQGAEMASLKQQNEDILARLDQLEAK